MTTLRLSLLARLAAAHLLLGATVGPAAAQTAPGPAAASPPQASPTSPKLIVAIVVDQLSSDLFAQYRSSFTGGLRRVAEGVVFPAGYQGQAATETCPGHATILTGVRPGRAGIIANNWFDLSASRADKKIYCAEDETVPDSASDRYTVSSTHLRVPALGDLMRSADPRARSVAVAGKDRAAVMLGGHRPSQRWWWGGEGFVSHASAAPDPAVAGVNANVAAALAVSREPLALAPVCRPRSRAVAVLGGGRPVGDGRFGRAAGDSRAFRASPELDGATLAVAAALRAEMRLGEGAATDLLAIGLSATDYVGHAFGTQGSEMCLQLLALDRSLGDFFAALDQTGIDYLVVLTSDHGGHDLPERMRDHAAPDAQRVDPALGATAMGRAIGERLGLGGPVLFGDSAFGDIYVDKGLPEPVRKRVLAEAVRAYRAHPQVAAVFTAAEIAATPTPSGPPDEWSLTARARASFDPARSGDFLVLLKPRVTPIHDTGRGYVATHGSPWDYDRRVPILFWRAGLTPFEQPLAVETADIMPTLAAAIGLPLAPGSTDGRCLDLIEGDASSCPAAPAGQQGRPLP